MTQRPKRILVPINGSNTDDDAFRLACGLSRESKSRLYALYIIEIKHELPLDAEVDSGEGETILRNIEAIGQEEKCHVDAEYIQARYAGPAIVQEALTRGVEVIVLGVPYKRHLGNFNLGETASYVLRNAHCPVILWRGRSGTNSAIGS